MMCCRKCWAVLGASEAGGPVADMISSTCSTAVSRAYTKQLSSQQEPRTAACFLTELLSWVGSKTDGLMIITCTLCDARTDTLLELTQDWVEQRCDSDGTVGQQQCNNRGCTGMVPADCKHAPSHLRFADL